MLGSGAQALRKTGSGFSLDENNLERLFWRENHAASTQQLYNRNWQQPLWQLCVDPVSREVHQNAPITLLISLPGLWVLLTWS